MAMKCITTVVLYEGERSDCILATTLVYKQTTRSAVINPLRKLSCSKTRRNTQKQVFVTAADHEMHRTVANGHHMPHHTAHKTLPPSTLVCVAHSICIISSRCSLFPRLSLHANKKSKGKGRVRNIIGRENLITSE